MAPDRNFLPHRLGARPVKSNKAKAKSLENVTLHDLLYTHADSFGMQQFPLCKRNCLPGGNVINRSQFSKRFEI